MGLAGLRARPARDGDADRPHGALPGHEGFREYFVDVARAWDEISLHAEDFRAIPGSVIVMGHVDARLKGEPVRRNAVWTWKVAAGKATHLRASDLGPAPREA